MYQVFKNKRVMFKGQQFANFEKARQAVRKYIRAKVAQQDYNSQLLASSNNEAMMWDDVSRNPTNYTNLGFRIFKVA